MNIKKLVLAGMLGLAPLSPLKAQKAAQLVGEAGCFGTVKSAPTAICGINGMRVKGNNVADVFMGGTLDKEAVPGFACIVFDNYSWNKNISSWARGLLLASKKSVTSTIDVAPVKFSSALGDKFNVAVMPAYCRQDDFLNGVTLRNIKAIVQSMISVNKKNRFCLEMQYGSIPAEKLSEVHFGKFSDTFNFTVTYQRMF